MLCRSSGYFKGGCVIPCLPSGLAKSNKIMSMFVLFSRLSFCYFESLAFFENGDKPYTKAARPGVFTNFSEAQQLSYIFS